MHYWGDEDFDWEALDEAGNYIWSKCHKVRLGIHWKEKYGTLRISPWPYNGMFHSLIWPGYVFSQYPYNWMWRLDCNLAWKILPRWFIGYIAKKQVRVLRDAWLEAAEKWPHIRKEILSEYEFTLGDI